VMLHRSLVGSMERLFGHLIEVHNGAFPAWYAPVQVAVLPLNVGGSAACPRSPGAAKSAPPLSEHDAAARFAAAAEAEGLRAEVHAEGSLGARVRDARRVPVVAVIGAREAAGGAV